MKKDKTQPVGPLQPASDPKLDPLLDEALSPHAVPGGLPEGLSERIIAATQGKLAAQHRNVLARIGTTRWLAVAASWALAGLLALWLSSIPIDPNGLSLRGELALLEEDIKSLTTYSGPNEAVDQELAVLAMQVEHVGAGHDYESVRSIDSYATEIDLESSEGELLF